MSTWRLERDSVQKGNVAAQYKPVEAVASYLKDALQFEVETTDSEKIRGNKLAGGEISQKQYDLEKEEENKKRKNLKERKKTILSKYIFPSMANLTTFFEGVNRHSELRGKFDEDIQALFFGGSQEDVNHEYVFNRFIRAVLAVDSDTPPDDFRFALIDMTQHEIYDRVTAMGSGKLSSDFLLNNVLYPDMGRAFSWTNSFAIQAYHNLSFDKDRRPVLF